MPVEIKFKVGIGCTNNKIDVGNIQDALGRIKPADGGAVPPLVIDGLCGKKTIDAIQKFQLKHFGWSGADGKIFPDGQTLKKINEILKDPVVTAPTGVRWRVEFNTGPKRNSLGKLETWYLYFTDLDEKKSYRFRLKRNGYDPVMVQTGAFGTAFEFRTTPELPRMSPLELQNAVFWYEYVRNKSTSLNQTDPFEWRIGTLRLTLPSGQSIKRSQVPLQIEDVDLKANQAGIFSDRVEGVLKNTTQPE